MNYTQKTKKRTAPDIDFEAATTAHEVAVIGYLLTHGGEPVRKDVMTVLSSLPAVNFQSERNAVLYSYIMKNAEKDGHLPGLPLIIEQANREQFSDIHADLGEIMKDGAATLYTFEACAAQIRQTATAREKRLDAAIYASDLDHAVTEEERQQAGADHRARLDKLEADAITPIVPYATIFEQLEEIERSDSPVRKTLPTGLDGLDALLGGGLGLSELVVLGGRCGDGKTMLGGQIAADLAARQVPTLFYTMEMTALQFCDRLRLNKVGEEEKLTLYLVGGGRTIAEVEQYTRTAVYRDGVRAVFIDFLGYVRRTQEQSRLMQFEFYGEVTRRLAELARRLNISIVLLCQINRDSAKQGNRVPILADLRGSGDIENYADYVFVLHTPDETKRTEKELWNLKSRHGETGGKITLELIAERRHFVEIGQSNTNSGTGDDNDDDVFQIYGGGDF